MMLRGLRLPKWIAPSDRQRRKTGRKSLGRAVHGRTLACEPLEDRCLLSVASPQIELSNASPAVSVQNEGQWADVSVGVPALAWSTYLGGSGNDDGKSIVVDAAGDIYVTAYTLSNDFPTTAGAYDTTYNGGCYDVFVSKFSSSGTLLWSTYLGGSGSDGGTWGGGIAVDAAGNVYVTGQTDSTDFPTAAGAYDTTYNGGVDAFVSKFSSSGTLLWSTYLGGNGGDLGYGIAVDAAGNAYVTGETRSSNFSTTTGAYDTTYNGGDDAFVSKFSSSGTLVWSTYLGGSSEEKGYGIDVDAAGNAYVTGFTVSTDFPTTADAYDTTYYGGNCYDAFVSRLSSSGTLLWSTYLGGSGDDCGDGIAVDAAGNAYVTGYAGDFPTTAGAYDTTYNGGYYDAFVSKLSSSGTLLWSTYLGASNYDFGCGIAVDTTGNAYVTGCTFSSHFPTTVGAYDTTYNGVNDDAFVVKISLNVPPVVVAGPGNIVVGNSTATFTITYADPDGMVVNSTIDCNDILVTGPDGFSERATRIGVDSTGDGPSLTATYQIVAPSLVWMLSDAGTYTVTMKAGEVSDKIGSCVAAGVLGTFEVAYLDLAWSTYMGGSGDDLGDGIAVDATGNTYVTGRTSSCGFPITAGAYDTTYNGGASDVFVSKWSPSGTLQWSTYLGGSAYDCGYDIAVDAAGSVYVTGGTNSDFPTTAGAYDTTYNGGVDAFVSKFSSSGTLLWSTYLGGSNCDEGYGIAVDAAGNAYVTGYTRSSDFSTTAGAYDTTYNGGDDALVSKFSSSGTLLWSTYLGGSNRDEGYGIAVDAAGNAYVTGYAGSSDFPATTGAYDTTYNGNSDVFVAKLSSSGTLLWSTYLGGGNGDLGYGIAVDAAGDAYVTGDTLSNDFPTTDGAYDTTCSYGDYDVFIAKLSSSGTLLWSTYLGGSGADSGYGIAVDMTGNAYVAGFTNSSDFPTTAAAYDTTYGAFLYDAFVSEFSSSGELLWSTCLGGCGHDVGKDIAVDAAGNAYVTGYTQYGYFPATAAAYDTTYNGDYDAFVAKISGFATVNLPPVVNAGGPYVATEGNAITFDASGSTDPDGDTLRYRWDFDSDGTWDTDWSTSPTATYTWTDNWTGTTTVEVSDGSHFATATATAMVNNLPPVLTVQNASGTANEGQPVVNQGAWSDVPLDTVVLTASVGAVMKNVDGTWSWSYTPADDAGQPSTVTITADDGEPGGVNSISFDLTVNNLPPTAASISGPTDGYQGVRGQVRTFVLTATDVSPIDQASDFTFVINWGDGAHQTVVCHSGGTASHVFAATGSYTVQIVTVADKDGGTTTLSGVQQTVAIGISEVQGTMLAIGGTAGNDKFMITDDIAPTVVSVTLANTSLGSFSGVASVFCFGQGGTDDAIQVFGTANDDSFAINGDTITVNGIAVDGNSIESRLANAAAGTDTFIVSGTASAGMTLDGGAGTADVLIGSDTENLWQLTAWGAGTLNTAIAFKNVENLTGGAQADAFQFGPTGAIAGKIDGAGGSDTLDYSAYGKAATVNLVTKTASGAPVIANLEQFTGSTATDSFFGVNAATTWLFDGVASGVGTWNVGSTVMTATLSGFENLKGGTKVDIFRFTDAADGFGTINGSDGIDQFDYSLVTSPVSVNLQTRVASKVACLGSIETVISGSGSDTLIGPNVTNIWNISGVNAGTVAAVTFSGFENLVGGDSGDTLLRVSGSNAWTLTGLKSGSLNGMNFAGMETLTGGSGVDTFLLETAASGFSMIDGGPGSADVLIGPDAESLWQLTAYGAGMLNTSTRFKNMENLTGGALADTFQISGSGAVFGTIDGGGGSDTLYGPNAATIWTINALNGGTVAGTKFASVENLMGGSANDTFKLSGSGSIAGTLDADTGTNVLDYSFFGTLGVTVNLQTGSATAIGGGGGGRLANIGIVVGTMGADTLTGNAGNNVLIGGSGVDTLQGGDGRDLLIGGTRQDQLNGGAGEDILIGGQCSYYPESTRTLNLTAISAIMAEWTRTDLGYLDRYNHLIASSGGLNGSYLLNASTVQSDFAAIDSLFGETDRDWFLASAEDLLADRVTSGEEAEELTLV